MTTSDARKRLAEQTEREFTGWPEITDHEARAALARVRAALDHLAAERDRIRAAYREHNAGRRQAYPIVRPDLDAWACAYEVAERALRAALDGTP